tara:strand:- start:659 stop:796 length:138 start_codon:yes stop_codon:yes gene_type:complete
MSLHASAIYILLWKIDQKDTLSEEGDIKIVDKKIKKKMTFALDFL